MCGFAVVDAISDIFISMGTRVSYRVGACKIIPAVPTTTAIVKIHKNNRSKTIATYFQSSFTWKICQLNSYSNMKTKIRKRV